MPGYPEAEPGQWQNWCIELEIIHGFDSADHQDTYIDQNLFHWEQGLRRLVLGACMAGADDGASHIFSTENQDYLPYDLPTDAPGISFSLASSRSLTRRGCSVRPLGAFDDDPVVRFLCRHG